MIAELNDLKLELWLREREKKSILWKTKDGKHIPINDMSDTHLVNAIKHLENKNNFGPDEGDIANIF